MQLTAADRVTLVRAGLGVVLAVMVGLIAIGELAERSWLLMAVAVPTLALDAVDGWVARRWDCVTSRGAIFDAEVDAGVVMILAVAAAFTLGPWVLVIGLARYGYFVLARIWPWFEQPLPPSRFRKAVAALQGIALTVALAPVTPMGLATGAALVAAALLATSFGSQAYEARRFRSEPAGVQTGHIAG